MTLNTTNSSDNLLTSIQQEYKILAEYKMIQLEDVGGVYVIPSHDNSFLWFGVIFVREGFYKDGIFRFNISLPDDFPNTKTVPTVIFQNHIFHPLICPYTGTLDLSYGFSQWVCGVSHIWQILKYIKYIFVYPYECVQQQQSIVDQQKNLTNNKFKILNKTATDLLLENKNEFINKVKECINESNERIYDTPPPTNDKHYIQFEKFNPDVHNIILENLKKQKNNDINNINNDGERGSTGTLTSSSPQISAGISWVKEGEFKSLSKDK